MLSWLRAKIVLSSFFKNSKFFVHKIYHDVKSMKIVKVLRDGRVVATTIVLLKHFDNR